MSIQSDLDSAKAAEAAAHQVVVDLEAKLEAAQPHISLWNEIEMYASQLPSEIQATLSQFAERAKQLLNI